MELRKQEVNSVHRQSLKKLAPHLKVTARSSEDEVIEGVESFTDAPFIGVQWHPEFLLGHKQLAAKDSFIILLRVLNKVLGLYIGATFEIEKEDVPKEKYSFDYLVYT